MEWININDQKPNTKQRVLVYFTSSSGKYSFVSVADFIEAKTVLVEEYGDENSWEVSEYDEEKDCYWIEEGFYEWSYESDMCWKLSESITYWMPIPEKPRSEF